MMVLKQKLQKMVFFDIDHTLVNEFSTKTVINFLFKKKEINLLFTIKALYWILLEKMHKLDTERVFREGGLALKGKDAKKMDKVIGECFDTKIKKNIFKEGEKLLERKKKTHVVVLVTEQYDAIAKHFKKYFNVKYLLCTKLEIKNGRFTGRLGGKICYSKNKVDMIKELIKKQKIETDFKVCESYSDNISDVPMLELVGKPFATNPDAELEKYAKEKSWEIIHFKSIS